ncbi:MAG TPA: NAD(P)H-dependent oxidoreductase [Cyclobacteriaceae bacterium]|nr:NAD(P)H-dependent oxidoreductase [Cyclobacteriaceae bacterium]
MKHLLLINGSASHASSNERIIRWLGNQLAGEFEVTLLGDLKVLPHFDPDLSSGRPPESIVNFRAQIEAADGVIICAPEYVFSIPAGLKNALEWCVATTVFTDKPVGLITAAASGTEAHEQLQRIMHTIMANFNTNTTLLIQGIKGKFNTEGQISDPTLICQLIAFKDAFVALCNPRQNMFKESPNRGGKCADE